MPNRTASSLLALSALTACTDSSLPGGYTVQHGDRGKAWLRSPDGTLVHGGALKDVYRDEGHILIIAYPELSDGQAGDRTPVERPCHVALLVDAATRSTEQITVAEAARRAARMTLAEKYDRPCLKGMPNTSS